MGRDFFEAVLSAAQVDVPLLAWGVWPFYASYFAGPDSWQECWEARLLLDGRMSYGRGRRPAVVGVGISASPEGIDETRTSLPVTVLADFTSLDAARTCRAALHERHAAARWDDVHWNRLAIRDVGPQHKQLLVEVNEVIRDGLEREQRVLAEAKQLIAICGEHGGRTQSRAHDKSSAGSDR
jgi:hypothetical protein